jgi:hypothetical protein
MQILVGILTLVFLYFYAQFVRQEIAEGHHLVLLGCFILTLIAGRLLSTEWEKEQDDKDFASWRQKWRFRLSRVWPMSGEVIPPEQNKLMDKAQRKFPESS